MERLTEHDRPLYGRSGEMVVKPLSPAEIAEAFPDTRDPVEILDIYVATGGYPRMVLDAKFRSDLAARTVLEAIGAVAVGHATFTSAVAQLGGDSAGTTLTRALPVLLNVKRVVARATPVGAAAS